jgi:hypothetical protein
MAHLHCTSNISQFTVITQNESKTLLLYHSKLQLKPLALIFDYQISDSYKQTTSH